MQTERLIVFHDIAPAAQGHLQVVLRHHIHNLDEVRPSSADHGLLLEMVATGQWVLDKLHPGAPQRLGFHCPPFNSMLHL